MNGDRVEVPIVTAASKEAERLAAEQLCAELHARRR
jgi:hypothetical protein